MLPRSLSPQAQPASPVRCGSVKLITQRGRVQVPPSHLTLSAPGGCHSATRSFHFPRAMKTARWSSSGLSRQSGMVIAKHTHLGEEISVVLEGELVFQMAGKSDVTVRAGQPLFVPSGVVHRVKASRTTKLLATHVVEKGKPLRSAAQ